MRISLFFLFIVFSIILYQINWCESTDLLKQEAKFKHSLFHFLYKHKKYIKKKGIAAAAVVAAHGLKKKRKVLPLPIPFPIP